MVQKRYQPGDGYHSHKRTFATATHLVAFLAPPRTRPSFCQNAKGISADRSRLPSPPGVRQVRGVNGPPSQPERLPELAHAARQSRPPSQPDLCSPPRIAVVTLKLRYRQVSQVDQSEYSQSPLAADRCHRPESGLAVDRRQDLISC